MFSFESLLSTKYCVPQANASLIERPRLIDRLEAGTRHALTLISAPAGFGKTTLLSGWIQSKYQWTAAGDGTLRVAWVSLDEDDNDLTRFWLYVISSLQRAGMNLEGSILPLLRVPQPPPIKTILTLLINELEPAQVDTLLVLDDYHLIHAQAIHDSLAYLVLHLPKPLHLMIATRADPPLPLSRLRVQNQLIEIRASDLLFTSSEIEAFLHESMGIALSPEGIAALEARTEGWIAGLQLAALSLRASPDLNSFVTHLAGSQRYVLDYLLDEVFTRLDPDLLYFLERTAILNQISAPLCDWVLGEPQPDAGGSHVSPSQAVLEELERSNLFLIPLDSEQRWFRFHHLFAECLVTRLEQSHPELLPQLHGRASQWYEAQNRLEEAIRHRLAAHEEDRAAELIERCIPQALERGYVGKIKRWMDRLPEPVRTARPRLCLLLALTIAQNGQPDEAESLLRRVEGQPEAQPLAWLVDGIRSSIAISKGNPAKAIEFAQASLAEMPETETPWRSLFTMYKGYAYFLTGNLILAGITLEEAFELGIHSGNLTVVLTTPAHLVNTYVLQAQLFRAEAVCQRALRTIAEKLGSADVPIPALLNMYAAMAKIRIEWNDLQGAEPFAQRAVELTEQSESLMFTPYNTLASLRAAQGRAQESVRLLEAKIDLFRGGKDLIRSAVAEAGLALHQIIAGDLQSAERWADNLPAVAFHRVGYIGEVNGMVLMRLLRAQGRYDEALEISDQLLEAAETARRTGRVLELQVFRAALLQSSGKTDQACGSLLGPLQLAEPENMLRTFLEEGPVMKKLLEAAVRQPEIAANPKLLAFACKILQAFENDPLRAQDAPEKSAGAPSANDRLIEPLTPRELDILRLMCTGATNQEIARQLIISLGTVKAHTHHIQGKLGTHNRTETVVLARELGLIPPR